jgi:hypothetical protein
MSTQSIIPENPELRSTRIGCHTGTKPLKGRFHHAKLRARASDIPLGVFLFVKYLTVAVALTATTYGDDANIAQNLDHRRIANEGQAKKNAAEAEFERRLRIADEDKRIAVEEEARKQKEKYAELEARRSKDVNWQLVLASGVAMFTIVSYVLTRRRELAWKRTEFLCVQAHYFDNDSVLVEVVTILEGRHADITRSQVFDGETGIDDPTRRLYLQKFDKLLNLLWRLSYAHLNTKTLSLGELEAFGWYFWLISESHTMVEYCDTNGFEEINIVIKKLKPRWEREDSRHT